MAKIAHAVRSKKMMLAAGSGTGVVALLVTTVAFARAPSIALTVPRSVAAGSTFKGPRVWLLQLRRIRQACELREHITVSRK